MEYSNDWDLQALVRSCGTAVADSEPEPPPAPSTTRRAEAETVVVGRAGGVPEFVGQPVRSAAASFYDLEYLDLYHELPRAPFLVTAPSTSRERGEGGEHEVLISFPAIASTSGQGRKQPGRKPGVRTARPKRRYKYIYTAHAALRKMNIFHCLFDEIISTNSCG